MLKLYSRAVKSSCNFVMEINTPVETMVRIFILLRERKILVEDFRFYSVKGGPGYFYLHCFIERDLIKAITEALFRLDGVASLEKI